MNSIESSIANYCLSGVEYKAIKEIFKIKNGYTPSKSKNEYWEGGNIPWFRMEDIRVNGRLLFDSIQHISAEAVKGELFCKDSIIITTSATIGEHALIKVPFLANQRFIALTLKDNFINAFDIKFLFYYGFLLAQWCKENVNNAGFASVDMSKFQHFRIPIPPLHIQQEIVNILDKFTQLEAELEKELEKELEARKAQYEYYRNELLTFADKEVEWKMLGEIGALKRGNGLQKKDFTQSGVGCIHYGQIYTYYGSSANETKSFVSKELAIRLTKVTSGDIIIATTSENMNDVCKAVAWLGDEIVTGGHAAVFKHNENPRYISYCFQTDFFFKQKNKFARGTKVIEISTNNLAKIKLPIPNLKIQDSIVTILDNFELLVNDLSKGLPAEINARKKQYEYYRNKLLTFKELEA